MLQYINTPPFLHRQPLPAGWTEVRAIAAMLDYPSARERARDHGVSPGQFRSEFARALAAELFDGSAISVRVAEAFNRHEPGLLPWRTCIWLSRQLSEWGTASESGAFAAVDMFAAETAAEQLAETFRWAADCVENDRFSSRDRDELVSLMDAAGIVSREVAA